MMVKVSVGSGLWRGHISRGRVMGRSRRTHATCMLVIQRYVGGRWEVAIGSGSGRVSLFRPRRPLAKACQSGHRQAHGHSGATAWTLRVEIVDSQGPDYIIVISPMLGEGTNPDPNPNPSPDPRLSSDPGTGKPKSE